MAREFSDELISAYLDGELTADEQALVEEALMDSEEHRATFNELRALRDQLQSLPEHRLESHFTERVMRQAERRMLSSQPTSSGSVADTQSSVATDEQRNNYTETNKVISAKSDAGHQDRRRQRAVVSFVGATSAAILIGILVVANLPNDNVPTTVLDSNDSKSGIEQPADRTGVNEKAKEREDGAKPPVVADEESDALNSADLARRKAVESAEALKARKALTFENAAMRDHADALPNAPSVDHSVRGLPKNVGTDGIAANQGSSTQPSGGLGGGGFGGVNLKPTNGSNASVGRELLGRFADGTVLDVNDSTTFDFVVCIDVPKDRLTARPVERTLEDNGIWELQLNAAAQSKGTGSESELLSAAVSPNTKNDNWLVVEAPDHQIEMICSELNETGLSIHHLDDVRHVDLSSVIELSKLRRQVSPDVVHTTPAKPKVSTSVAEADIPHDRPPRRYLARDEAGQRPARENKTLDGGSKTEAPPTPATSPAPAGPKTPLAATEPRQSGKKGDPSLDKTDDDDFGDAAFGLAKSKGERDLAVVTDKPRGAVAPAGSESSVTRSRATNSFYYSFIPPTAELAREQELAEAVESVREIEQQAEKFPARSSPADPVARRGRKVDLARPADQFAAEVEAVDAVAGASTRKQRRVLFIVRAVESTPAASAETRALPALPPKSSPND